MLKPFLRRYAETEFDQWKVATFTLFSSRLAPDGSIYTAEMQRELL